MQTNGNEEKNGEPGVEEKKKLNKKERKEARQQKNRKAPKNTEKTDTQEGDQTGKNEKKDKKRRHSNDEEQNGHDAENKTSNKKMKSKLSVAILSHPGHGYSGRVETRATGLKLFLFHLSSERLLQVSKGTHWILQQRTISHNCLHHFPLSRRFVTIPWLRPHRGFRG